MLDVPVKITALSSSNISDRLWLCWGHVDNWRSLQIVLKSKEWLNKVNDVFTPTTFIAYKNNVPIGMIEFMPHELLEQLGLCPCRIDVEHHEIEKRYILGKEFNDYLFISCLSVAKDHQQKGVGRALLDNFLGSKVLREHGGALVYVRERDQSWESFIHWPAGPEEFYFKAGFSTIKTLNNPAGRLLCYKR
jgi:ribosomal protein S18 acetylase RimI-like enzyme